MMTDAYSGEDDESEEEVNDEAPPELPALQFSHEAMKPGMDYLAKDQNLANLLTKVSVVSMFTNPVHAL